MPPKKSKAARKTPEDDEEVNGIDKPVEEENDAEEEGAGDSTHKNIFEETMVEGKRKRTLPPTEAKLVEW